MTMSLLIISVSSLSAQNASDILRPDMGMKLGVCPVCGMDITERMFTRVTLFAGDTAAYACGLGCAAALMLERQWDSIRVVDFDSLKTVPALGACYLFGSRIVPARAMLPVLSFASRESALRFQQRHGGTVLWGKEAFDAASRIRRERMNSSKKGQRS